MHDSLSILLLQLVVIVTAAKGLGACFNRWGQPAVVGEIMGGILLGPSFFGWIWPGAYHALFPRESMGALDLLSQVGIVLFMFAVGMEFDGKHLRAKAKAAVVVSQASMAIPFALGLAVSGFLAGRYGGGKDWAFALFMGVAMSITAFPVLARILHETGLARTPIGNMALACAAVGDVTAWLLLALVAALAASQALTGVLATLAGVVFFSGLMVFVVRPGLGRVLKLPADGDELKATVVALLLVLVFLSAWMTQRMGLHALFGAFLAGTIMPDRHSIRGLLKERVETLTGALFLPLFFAFIGLRTEIGQLADVTDWLWCLLVLALAVMGKVGGSAAAARWTGMRWRESLILGVLMNTRGLMEIVALNLGYELGVIGPAMFTMLILMAVVTTLMTGPLLRLLRAC